MIYARQLPSGRLVDIRRYGKAEAEGRADLVPLERRPAGFGPFVYDPATQRAIPAPLSQEEKADRVKLRGRVLAALVVRAAPGSTVAEKAWAGQILDAALEQVRNALR